MSILLLLDGAGGTPSNAGPPAGVIGLTAPTTTPYTRSDFSAKQGDTAVVFADALTYSNGAEADLSGATVEFVMRSLASGAPISITGTVAVIVASQGLVQFTPAAGDTDLPGEYMQTWRVTFPSGLVMDFPTVGYNTVTIEENLTSSGGQQLVSVPDLKDYLAIEAADRKHDAKLARFIRAARPVVENITGPIIPASYTEWHPGGAPDIAVRRRPSTSYGTSPVFTVQSVTEFTGRTEHDLAGVADPTLGSTFSYMIDAPGFISRLTGSGRGCFGGPVRVTYTAGQNPIPANVYEAALELLRVNYETTMAAGRGRLTVADDQDTGPPLGFFVPRRVRELLAPNRRAPAIF